MANELVHGTVGTTLTQSEYEAVGAHVFNSQATGDVAYASSATQLSRLAIGATDTVLVVSGGIPAWSAQLTLTHATQPLRLGYSATKYVNFAITSGGVLQITPDTGNGVQLTQGNNWGPIAHNGVDLGSSGVRWSNIYAGNGVTTPLVTVGSAGTIAGAGTGANGFKLKNLKNAAATALSGTQLDVEIDIGGTPYYFTVYPTKA